MSSPVRGRRRPALPALLMALAATTCALALAPAAEASRSQFTVFDAPRELTSDPATRESTLDEIQSLGVDSIRVILYWHSVARTPTPGATRASGAPTLATTTGAGMHR